MLTPNSISDLLEIVSDQSSLIPVGNGTKNALADSAPEEFTRISMSNLSGIVEYDPSEYTITALAGTSLSTIEKALSENGQYLPFDPPFSKQGATIGGTVAAGLSGPGSYRFGPVRDFLIGVKFVAGNARLITGGGKVVKNAAGFDIPKFLIGSCGRLGIIAEVTFKVFPKPESNLTFGIKAGGNCSDIISQLSRAAFDLDFIEFDPSENLVACGISGNAEALRPRMKKIEETLSVEVFKYALEGSLNFTWADADIPLAKFPCAPKQIHDLEKRFDARRRFSMGGNVLYLNANFDSLSKAGKGLVFRSSQPISSPWVGEKKRPEVENAIKLAFDPNSKFPPLA